MTERMSMITFGNAKLNSSDIRSKKTVEQNGETYYVVNFKNGAQVKYPKQSPDNNACIFVSEDQMFAHYSSPRYENNPSKFNYLYNNIASTNENAPLVRQDLIDGPAISESSNRYKISQFYGLEFTGTEKPDEIDLMGCTSCTVDVRGGNSSYTQDTVTIYSTTKFKSHKNSVKNDGADVVTSF